MINSAPFADLDAPTLYRILRLRSEVFVVEQACLFNNVDGHDEHAVLLWVDGTDGTVAATARLLPGDEYELGRIVTAPDARDRGLASALVDAALDLVPPGVAVVLNAQSRLEAWYGRWGFARTGPDIDIDGMPHVPMRLRR